MKIRAFIILSALSLLLSSCRQETSEPEDFAVPEFIDIKYDFGSFLENRFAVLTASLSNSSGIKNAGFMIGYDEANLAYKESELKDLKISYTMNYLDYDTEYCFYAKASNGVSQIRTRLIRFRTPKKGEDFGSGQDTPGGSDNSGDGDGPGDDTEDNPVEPVMPPEGVGIIVSDDNFLLYLIGLCDSNHDGVILADESTTVREIDVCTDDIRTLDGIQYFPSLKTLVADGSVWNGKLTSVSLASNSSLEKLSCRYNHIETMLLPSSLVELDFRFNNVREPDFKGLGKLRKLDCFGNGISSIDLSPLVSLEELVCGMNAFETLDVSSNPNLKVLDLSDSPMLRTVYVARGHKIETIIAENSIDIKYKE